MKNLFEILNGGNRTVANFLKEEVRIIEGVARLLCDLFLGGGGESEW